MNLGKFVSSALAVLILSVCAFSSLLQTNAATVNGKELNIGDKIEYSVYLNPQKTKIAAVNLQITYDDNVLSIIKNSDGEYDITSEGFSGGSIFNADLDNRIMFNAASGINGYNFNTAKKMITVNFEVKGKGSTNIDYQIRELFDMDYVNIPASDTYSEINYSSKGQTQPNDSSSSSVSSNSNVSSSVNSGSVSSSSNGAESSKTNNDNSNNSSIVSSENTSVAANSTAASNAAATDTEQLQSSDNNTTQTEENISSAADKQTESEENNTENQDTSSDKVQPENSNNTALIIISIAAVLIIAGVTVFIILKTKKSVKK